MEYFKTYHREPRTERERENLYGRIRTIAYWLDSFATVGGLNVGLEAIVGFIPVIVGLIPWVGDILDVFYKSNQYNLTILSNWLMENRLVDVRAYNREHPLGNGEPEGRNRSRSRATAAGVGAGSSRGF
ncbi:hypothetical protein EC991_004062 [Linnemannia zychae]|nr:hypothetical protein EC991_004062 [Linnemannia zychae]